MSRREFSLFAGAAVFGFRAARAGQEPRLPISLVLAPSNLGLRPENGQQPGTWRAPQVLMDAGLRDALDAVAAYRLERPLYQVDAQRGTRIRNGNTIRAFSLALAAKVKDILAVHGFPVVIGGDCSVLLGSLLGLRQAGGRGLVHVDGHSDFAQEKSYATPQTLGSAAGMDLALATGRGETLLTDWPEVGRLADDADTIQVGERGRNQPGFMEYYGDILATAITRIDVQDVLAGGTAAAARRVTERLESRGLDRAWLHVDLDVLDEKVMPAVDSPGSPGFDYRQLAELIAALVASGRIAGADFAIYDPERDPGHAHARGIVDCIADGLRPLSARKA